MPLSFTSEPPLDRDIGPSLNQALRDYDIMYSSKPSKIVMDLPHIMAFRSIYTPQLIPGEDISDHVMAFDSIPIAFSKGVEGVVLED